VYKSLGEGGNWERVKAWTKIIGKLIKLAEKVQSVTFFSRIY